MVLIFFRCAGIFIRIRWRLRVEYGMRARPAMELLPCETLEMSLSTSADGNSRTAAASFRSGR